jgi:hypothetical protein
MRYRRGRQRAALFAGVQISCMGQGILLAVQQEMVLHEKRLCLGSQLGLDPAFPCAEAFL